MKPQKHLFIFESGDVFYGTPDQAQTAAKRAAVFNSVKSFRYKRIDTDGRRFKWKEVKNPAGRYEYGREYKEPAFNYYS